MFTPNVNRILESIRSNDVVLDIGGWACPFNRANFVMDAGPFETRGYYGTQGLPASQGGDKEFFSKESWIQRDICGREPFPFRDKEFDFVICSHTLEDIRDPLWVCSEMVRIAKRGYIEVPSRAAESSRGWEGPRTAGLSHHRWLIDMDQDHASIRFLMKFHMIHSHWRFSLPHSYLARMPEEQTVQWLFWEDAFQFEELLIHGQANLAAELERFVQITRPYSRWALRTDALLRTTQAGLSRIVHGIKRRVISRG